MRKIISVFCVLLAMVLLLGSSLVAMADAMSPEDTLMDNPRYANSFLLWVNCQTKHEYTLADFPDVERLYYVSTVKLTATETGYQYLLLMAIDNYNLAEAVEQASAYGMVLNNYLASDYADANSYMELNYTELELKVGESVQLEVPHYSVAPDRYGLAGVVFTVDPEIVDENALVESEYLNWGISSISGDQEEPKTSPWYEEVAVVRESNNSKYKQVSPLHSYYGSFDYGQNIFKAMNTLANHPGIIKAELVYEGLAVLAVMPYVSFSWSPKGVIDIEGGGSTFKGTVKALQPGEVMITAKVRGGGTGTATATCKVTVVEDELPAPETPTDTPTDVTPTDIPYGDVNGDTKIDAKDALMVLKYAVQKMELTQAQQKAAEVDGKDGINAKDALEILKYSVKKITKFPIEEIVITPTDVTPTDK